MIIKPCHQVFEGNRARGDRSENNESCRIRIESEMGRVRAVEQTYIGLEIEDGGVEGRRRWGWDGWLMEWNGKGREDGTGGLLVRGWKENRIGRGWVGCEKEQGIC